MNYSLTPHQLGWLYILNFQLSESRVLGYEEEVKANKEMDTLLNANNINLSMAEELYDNDGCPVHTTPEVQEACWNIIDNEPEDDSKLVLYYSVMNYFVENPKDITADNLYNHLIRLVTP